MLLAWYQLVKDAKDKMMNYSTLNSSDSTACVKDTTKGAMMGTSHRITKKIDTGIPYEEWGLTKTSSSFGGWFYFSRSELESTVSQTSNPNNLPITVNLLGHNNYGGLSLILRYNNSDGWRVLSCCRLGCNTTNSPVLLFRESNKYPIELDTWIHLFLVYDLENLTMNLYINSEIKHVVPLSINPVKSGVNDTKHVDTFKICENMNNGGDKIVLSLPFYANDIRVYNNAISELEIKNIYNRLILHYDFNSSCEPYINLAYGVDPLVYNYKSQKNSITKLENETFKGAAIYRLKFNVSDPVALNMFQTYTWGQGICIHNNYVMKPDTKYCYYVYWRAITHSKNIILDHNPSNNIHDITTIPSRKVDDEWNVVGQYRQGGVVQPETYTVYFSFRSLDIELNEDIIIDFACPTVLEGTDKIIDYDLYEKYVYSDKYQKNNVGDVYDSSGYNNDGVVGYNCAISNSMILDLSYLRNNSKINILNSWGKSTQVQTTQGKNSWNSDKQTLAYCTYSNGVYTSSDNDTATILQIKTYQALLDKTPIAASLVYINITNINTRYSMTFTIFDTAKYIRLANYGIVAECSIWIPITHPVGTQLTLSFRVIDATIGAWKIDQLQLEVGSTATTYEPFIPNSPSPDYPSPISSAGDSGSIIIRKIGRNIFNVNEFKRICLTAQPYITAQTIDGKDCVVGQCDNFYILSGQTANRYNENNNFYNFEPFLHLKPKRYYFSIRIKNITLPSGDVSLTFYFITKSNSNVAVFAVKGGTSEWQTFELKNINVGEEIIGFFFSYSYGCKVAIDLDSIYMTEEPEYSKYHPYTQEDITIPLSSPLLSVPNGGRDKIVINNDNKSISIVRNIKKIKLTSSLNWYTHISTIDGLSITTFHCDNTDFALGYKTSFCSKYKNVNTSWNNSQFGIYSDHTSFSNKYFRPPNESITTLDQWKTWLDTNDVDLVYQLATPYTEEIPWQTEFESMNTSGNYLYIADKNIVNLEVISTPNYPYYINDNTTPSGRGYYCFDNPSTVIEMHNFYLTNDYTISFWVYCLDSGVRSIYCGNNGTASKNQFNIERVSGNNIRIYYKNDDTLLDLRTTQTIPINTWTLITVSVKYKTGLYVYINGDKVSERLDSNLFINPIPGVPFRIGRDYRINGDNTKTNFVGYMADFKIFNSCLSDQDINNMYYSSIKLDNTGSCIAGYIDTYNGKSNNLLYNGDFSKGVEGFGSPTLPSATDDKYDYCVDFNTFRLNPDRVDYQLISLNTNDNQYKISVDIKIDKDDVDQTDLFCVIRPLDSNLRVLYSADTIYKLGTETTLAKDLNPGDTTITLTSGAKWVANSSDPYWDKTVGFCENLAYGYDRATSLISSKSAGGGFIEVNGNVITLCGSYSGPTKLAGTKIANYQDGSTGYYPFSLTKAQAASLRGAGWVHYEAITPIKPWALSMSNNKMKYCTYAKIGFWSQNRKMRVANFKIENITNPQNQRTLIAQTDITSDNIVSINTASINSDHMYEIGMPIRYIRNWLNGSDKNGYIHWCEIQAYNPEGNNIAFDKATSINNGSYEKRTCTTRFRDTIGSSDYDPYIYIIGPGSITLDLGFVEIITHIKLWHYFGDSRTYINNIVEVSSDGIEWVKVFDSSIDGEYVETVKGKTIYLENKNFYINASKSIHAKEFIIE